MIHDHAIWECLLYLYNCVLSPGNRNKYLENGKDLTNEVKLWQTYFIADKNIEGTSHSNTNTHVYSSSSITTTIQK